MTSLATLLGMIPMALGIGSRQRAICAAGARHYRRPGVSVVVTVFLVPAVYLLVHGRHEKKMPQKERYREMTSDKHQLIPCSMLICSACVRCFRYSICTDRKRMKQLARCAAGRPDLLAAIPQQAAPGDSQGTSQPPQVKQAALRSDPQLDAGGG